MEEIYRMQKYLLLIRRAVGWTAVEFGEKIGVTRQTINNIESGRNKLTKTQYIAMRSVLDAEIIKNPEETEMLNVLLDMLVDHPEKYSEEQVKQAVDQANLLSPSILAGSATRKAVSKEWMKVAGIAAAAGVGALAGPLNGIVPAALAAGATGVALGAKGKESWMDKIIKSHKKKGDK